MKQVTNLDNNIAIGTPLFLPTHTHTHTHIRTLSPSHTPSHMHSFTAYPPWSGVPVWVVVSLLGTLVATAISVGVLPGVNG